LDLGLRCYLPNLENRLATITALHEAVDAAFKTAKIEISFPQRDLHVRTLPSNLPVAGLYTGQELAVSPERQLEVPETD
ncbi:MAG: hypothetical protein WBH50_10535, partial [Fuerstiella sp.]